MDPYVVIANTLARVTARVVERSAFVRNRVRTAKFKGKARVVSFLRPIPGQPVVECDGIKFRTSLDDDMQRGVFFNTFDAEIDLVVSVLSEGAFCLDIGANIGFYALHLAKFGTVHAFECDPDNFQRLTENIGLNDWADVHAHELAVADRNETLSFYRSGVGHSGWGSLAKFEDIAVSQVTVQSITLDSFLTAQAIKRVDLLKIDVEGVEFELLAGAERSLRERVFHYILIEFNGTRLAERGKTFAEFDHLFTSYQYSPVLINLGLYQRMKAGIDTHLCTNFLFVADQRGRSCEI